MPDWTRQSIFIYGVFFLIGFEVTR